MKQVSNFYDREIEALLKDILGMAELVSHYLDESVDALVRQDKEKAQAVVDADDQIDDIDHAIEMKALEVISLQQPARNDLRVLASVLRITKELERVGDYAVNIAQVAVKLADLGIYFKPLEDIPVMAREARKMLDMAVMAFRDCNVDLARKVAEADDPVDRLFYQLQEELAGWMKKDPVYVDQACQLALVVRYLERVADHAVNVSEMACFRHTGERRPFSQRPRRVK